jgi:hypothetical protein
MSLDQQSPTQRVYNVKDMGCACDGVFSNGVWTGTDDRAVLQRIIDTVNTAGGGVLWFPGFAMVTQNGGQSFCLSLSNYSNITFAASKGKGGVVQAAGLAAQSIAAIRLVECNNITFDGFTVDGNWGNAVTYVSLASTNVVLPQATINVGDTSGFPVGPSSFSIVTPTGVQVITYTGKTATSFTGCAGGAGTIIFGQRAGFSNSNTGLNQGTQVDPKNYGVMVRGSTDIVFDNCLFKNNYGDAIWIGGSANDVNTGSNNVRIQNTDIDLAARSGVAFPGTCTNISVIACNLTNIFASAVDTEPLQNPCRDIMLEKCILGCWWDPGRAPTGVNAVSIVGGSTSAPSQQTQARKYRLSDCTVLGGILVQAALDIVIERCRIIIDFFPSGVQSFAPVVIENQCDSVQILDNYIYDRVPGTPGGRHDASIVAEFSASSSKRGQPSGITIRGNYVYSRAGTTGILAAGVGGGNSNNAYQTTVSGVATATSGTTMTDGGAAWVVNQWAGWMVRIGTATAAVLSNTATVLTLDTGAAEFAALAWGFPLGEHAGTPAAGAYTIFQPTGIVRICDNHVDCSNDGYGQGANGIRVSNDQNGTSAAGMRVWVHDNTVKNCTDDGIVVAFVGATNWQQIWIHNNTGHDDQGTPTMTTLLRFTGTPHYNQLVLYNNQPGTSVATAVAGLTTGTWTVSGGLAPMFAGYGSPETVITAPIGSMYQRLNGTSGLVLYVKESGTGNTGWVAYASPNSASPKVVHQTFPVNGSTVLQSIGPVLTITGTPASTGSSGSMFAGYQHINIASAGGAGSACGYRNTSGNYTRGSTAGGGFRVVWRFGWNDAVLVATANMFVGLQADTAAPTDVAPSTLTNLIGVGCNNGDTQMQLYAAGGAAQARTALGASFPVNTVGIELYELELQCDPSATTVNYKLTRMNTNDIVSGVISVAAQLPIGSQLLTNAMWRSNGGTAAAVTMSFFSYYAELIA